MTDEGMHIVIASGPASSKQHAHGPPATQWRHPVHAGTGTSAHRIVQGAQRLTVRSPPVLFQVCLCLDAKLWKNISNSSSSSGNSSHINTTE